MRIANSADDVTKEGCALTLTLRSVDERLVDFADLVQVSPATRTRGG